MCYDFILSVLSLLVTALIGFQIWNVIQIETRFKRRVSSAVDKVRADLSKEIQKTNSETICELLLSASQGISGKWNSNALTLALEALILALENKNGKVSLCIQYLVSEFQDTELTITPAMYEGVTDAIYNSSPEIASSEEMKKLREFISTLKINNVW